MMIPQDRFLKGNPLITIFLVVALWGLPRLAPGMAPPARGYQHGVVAADHLLASRAGRAILQQGGNAVDAACAAAFVLGVVNPMGSGLGGGGFMLIKRRHQQPVALDFRETAPAAATAQLFLKPGLPAQASRRGGLAVATPGEVLGCAEALSRFGRLPLAQVLQPAIRHARRGFLVGHHLAQTVRRLAPELQQHPQLAALFLPQGKPLFIGQRLRRLQLARTLRALARHGPAVFYRGRIARAIVQTVQKNGGVMTAQDLARYRVSWRTPLVGQYRGNTIYTMPPPSSGGVALLESLNILEPEDLRALGHNSSAYLHRLAESLKHAFADRAYYLGDTDFVKVPLQRLTSKTYAAALRRRLGDRTAPTGSYGSPKGKATPPAEPPGTSHISVADEEGTAVALTTTINTSFGAMLVAQGTGILLNNQMDDFTTRPAAPNAFGLTQSAQNQVAPNKRPLSSMCPTLVVRQGELVAVVGASGGPTIITGTLQVVLNVLDFHLDAQEAVSRSRIHHQWRPDQLVVETDLPQDVTANLTRRGHKLKPIAHPFTAVQLVLRREGLLYGASDPRKAGQSAGY